LNAENIKNVSRPIICKEIKSVIKRLPIKKSPGLNDFSVKSHKSFKELAAMLLKVFQTIEREGTLPNSF
jgi:hypothetical protein